MALFSIIDLDSKKLEPLIIGLLGVAALMLLYKHMKDTAANNQQDQASQASADYVQGITDLTELQQLTGTGTSTTGASEMPTYSAPTSATVSPTLNGGATSPAGTAGHANTLNFEIPALPFSTVSTNFGSASTGSGA